MEEYASYLFQIVCLLIVAVIVLSLCLLGCFKSVRSARTSDPPNGVVCLENNQMDEPTTEDKEGNSLRTTIGHERALPEIPPPLTRVATSMDEEEEEDDSIYDIILKSKKTHHLIDNQPHIPGPSGSVPIQSRSKTNRKQHPYEKVGGDTDGDSSTYGPPSRDPLYAGIKDVTRKDPPDDDYRVSASANIAAEALYTPDIFYVGGDNPTNNNASRFPTSFPINHSPLLPPRNYPDFSATPASSRNSHSSNVASTDQQGLDPHHIPNFQEGIWQFGLPGNLFNGLSDVNPDNNEQIGEANAMSDDQRVPNYSSVTARESLNNLRKRGQLLSRDNQDEMYDTINYDAMKSSLRMQRTNTVLSSDHVYCTTGSDLYAEISTGQSSSRSSMYARVSDILPHTNSNFSLTQQASTSNPSRMDPPSILRRTSSPMAASSSAFGTASSNPADTSSPRVCSPSRSSTRVSHNADFPIYSVVNKPGRPKTFHDSSRLNNPVVDCSSLRKSCIDNSPSFHKTNMHFSPLSCEHGQAPSSPTGEPSLGASDAKRDGVVMRMKYKTEPGYAKILFTKVDKATDTGESRRDKYNSIYDCVEDDAVYEPVPVDVEFKSSKFTSQIKLKTNEKIKIPWWEKHKKSSDESKRDLDMKKVKHLNGYGHEPAALMNYATFNGLVPNSELRNHLSRSSPVHNSVPLNCSSFPRFDWNRRNIVSAPDKSSEASSTLGKSRFYITNEIPIDELPQTENRTVTLLSGAKEGINNHHQNNNNGHHHSSSSSPSSSLLPQPRIKTPPIREHIYELVKDAAYIDDDVDDDVVLESDV